MPVVARRTASLVRNIRVGRPCSAAATATRKATVTRSGASMPVIRLMTAFCAMVCFSFESVRSGGLSKGGSVRSGPVGGQGDGAHAVLAAGVLRLGGEELVFGYLADGVDGQAGGLDRRLVVDLGGR